MNAAAYRNRRVGLRFDALAERDDRRINRRALGIFGQTCRTEQESRRDTVMNADFRVARIVHGSVCAREQERMSGYRDRGNVGRGERESSAQIETGVDH